LEEEKEKTLIIWLEEEREKTLIIWLEEEKEKTLIIWLEEEREKTLIISYLLDRPLCAGDSRVRALSPTYTFSSPPTKFLEFPEILICDQDVGQDFIVFDFFHGRKILKVDGRDPQNREKKILLGKGEDSYHLVGGRKGEDSYHLVGGRKGEDSNHLVGGRKGEDDKSLLLFFLQPDD
jgi:hypothetical protein